MSDDTWAGLADQFADEAYASVKGYVRTYVLHQQLLEHLPRTSGAGARRRRRRGPSVVSPRPGRLRRDAARSVAGDAGQGAERLARLPAEAQQRVTLLQADGENADEAVEGRRFAGVLCHGVLGYLEEPRAVGRPAVPVRRCRRRGLDHDGQRQGDGGAPGPGTAVGRRPGGVRRHEPGSGCWGCPGGPTRWRNSASHAQPGRGATALVRGVAVRRLARVQRGRVGPERHGAGGGDGRGRTRSQPARPLPPTQPGLSSRGAQRLQRDGRRGRGDVGRGRGDVDAGTWDAGTWGRGTRDVGTVV